MGGNIHRWFSLKASKRPSCELDLATHGHATAASSLGAVHWIPFTGKQWQWYLEVECNLVIYRAILADNHQIDVVESSDL